MPCILPKNLAFFGCRLILMLLVCCTTVNRVDAEETPVDPAQIDEWIVQLDDDLYSVRKSAQQGLESAGQQALEAIAKEAQSGSLESSTRALNVMLAWTESKDHELQIAALEKLVSLPNRPIESGLAAELLADAYEQHALKSLVALGGRFEADLQVRAAPVITRLPNLHLIVDSKWKGELDGLKHLAAVHRATTISFYFAPLDDGVLEYLTNLPNVLRIEFYGTPISEAVAEQLRKQLPQATIVVTQGALLGIHGDPARQGSVVILQASEGFAAAKAGLRKGDTITEFQGEKLKDFHDLTTRIGKFKPGETVELTILRNGELMKKQVTFDRWGKQLSGKTGEAGRTFPNRQVLPAPRRITLERR